MLAEEEEEEFAEMLMLGVGMEAGISLEVKGSVGASACKCVRDERREKNEKKGQECEKERQKEQ